MVKRKSFARGVTLVEIMVVVAILGIISTIVPRFYIQVQRFFFLNNARIEIQRNGRDIMNTITRQIRQADSDTLSISRYNSQPHFSKVNFTDIDGRAVGFYQNGRNLHMVVNGSTRTMTTYLRYMSFSLPRSDDMGIISVDITLEKATYEGRTKFLHMASEKVRIMN